MVWIFTPFKGVKKSHPNEISSLNRPVHSMNLPVCPFVGQTRRYRSHQLLLNHFQGFQHLALP